MLSLGKVSNSFYSSYIRIQWGCMALVITIPILKRVMGKKHKSLDHILQGAQAFLLGDFITALYRSTGIEVAIHEMLGHKFLGCYMSYVFTQNNAPYCVVYNFEKLRSAISSTNPPEKIDHFLTWLFSTPESGTTTMDIPHSLTPFGSLLGVDGRSAWFRITGSIPSFFISACAVTIGARLKKTHIRLGHALTTFGLLSSFMNCGYAWQAVGDPSYPPLRSLDSHDFIQFSEAMSRITGVKPRNVAIATALLMTFSTPLLTLYLHSQQNKKCIAPVVIDKKHEEKDNSSELGSYLSAVSLFAHSSPSKHNKLEPQDHEITLESGCAAGL